MPWLTWFVKVAGTLVEESISSVSSPFTEMASEGLSITSDIPNIISWSSSLIVSASCLACCLFAILSSSCNNLCF